ncbi:MAG: DUF5110 domain-containing protein [Oligoflexales bacterium]|nr:DUF5110 domain-containing protein [Oligoflexales bacterium]
MTTQISNFIFTQRKKFKSFLMLNFLLTSSVFAENALEQFQYRVKITNANSYIIVEALSDRLIHVESSAKLPGPSVETALFRSLLLDKNAAKGAGPQTFKVSGTQIETAELLLKIDTTSLCVEFFKQNNQKLLNKICPQKLAEATKFLSFDAPNVKNIYGLGQYMSGTDDLNPDWQGKIWEPGPYGNMMRGYYGGATANTQMPVLYAMGENKDHHGIFLDNIYRQRWDFTNSPWTLETWGDQLRYFFFADENLIELRKQYLNLTGLAPLPHRQLFGLWASEFGFDNWQELNQALNSLKQKKYPLDGVALDLQWYGTEFNNPDASTMGSLKWDESRFADPAQYIKQLQDRQGLQMMLIEQPYISSAIPEYRMLDAQGLMVKDCEFCASTFITYSTWWGRGGMLDFTNPQTNEFWHREKRRKLIDIGVIGHWTDLGEPEMYHAHAWYHGFPEQNLHQHGDVHNIYNYKWVEGIYQGYRKDKLKDRPIILSRSGNSGIQRFGVALWSGDIGANLPSLRSQIRAQNNVSLSGIDYYGSDVGGFYRASGDGREHTLYTMWFANAALFEVPVRVHVWNLDNKNSSLPSKIGHHESHLKNIRRRYELTPYYYSLAHLASTKGEALVAPLFYHWSNDLNVRNIGDQKMIGSHLMGAAITEYEQVSRRVYLPSGSWFDYNTGEHLSSKDGIWLENYPLFRNGQLTLPLFARAGTILPQMLVSENGTNALGRDLKKRVNKTFVVEVFPSEEKSEFDVYEDDGKTIAYENGNYATTNVSQISKDEAISINIGKTIGNFTELPNKRAFLIKINDARRDWQKASFANASLQECSPQTKELILFARDFSSAEACYFAEQSKIYVNIGLLESNTEKILDLKVPFLPERQESQVHFVCRHAQTSIGSSVYISGSDPKLGAWDPTKAIKLQPNAYPTWSTIVEGLSNAGAVKWKCLKKSDDGLLIEWQLGEDNEVTLKNGFMESQANLIPN